MKAIFSSLLLASSVSFAGVCDLFVERTACPGKEKESYVKCAGEKSCTAKKKAETEAECKKLAEDDCSNSRIDITKSKVVKYTFGGKQSDNVCAADRPDYNKCK